MAERHNTVVCSFDPSSPRITAHDIHEWIHATLRLPEQKVTMIQIDGIKRQVFIKLLDNESVHALLSETGGQAEYKYSSGELSVVNLAVAGMGTKRIRVANLPPEVPNDTLRAALSHFGKVQDIHTEIWSKAYRYSVANGIRQVSITLTRHVPSHLTVAGHRVLLSYDGQPVTCYGCGEANHMYSVCPSRQRTNTTRAIPTAATYASILTSAAAAAEQQIEGIHTEVKYTTECTDAITKTTESNERSREPETSTLETGAPDATENNPKPHAEDLDTALHDVMQHDNILDRKQVLDAETKLGTLRIRRKGEQYAQDNRAETPCTPHPQEDTGNLSGSDEMEIGVTATGTTGHSKDGTHGDTRASPKRTKKMKVENIEEHLSELTRNVSKRVTYKSGKTQ